MNSFRPLLAITLLAAAGLCAAQPAGITQEMINTTLPEEGAPKAVAGPHAVTSAPAFGNTGLHALHPTDLASFPQREKLPLVVWSHGGCAMNNPRFYGFLGTIASHGFLVVTTASTETPPPGTRAPSATVDNLKAAITWAAAENERAGSPLRGKIDMQSVAAMGQSCGGILAIGAGLDPRVDTVVVFNSGVDPANPAAPPSDRPTLESLKDLRGSVLFVDGNERDFAMLRSRSSYDAIQHLPAFYGSRKGAGHLMTFYHPGGGEMANVASNWVRWQLKGDKEAARMFVGDKCGLCTNPDWVTASKRLVP